MTFRQWLIRKYKGADCPEGDLCKDMQYEYSFRHKYPELAQEYGYAPWKNTRLGIRRHLVRLGACSAAIETFESAWQEYKSDTTDNTD